MSSHLLENFEEISIDKLSEVTSWDQRIKILLQLDIQKLHRNQYLNETIKNRKKVLDHEQSFYNESLRLMNDSKVSLIKKWNELLRKYPEATYNDEDIEIMVQAFYSDFQKDFIRINHKYLPLQQSIFHSSKDQIEMLSLGRNNFFLTSIGILGLYSLDDTQINKDSFFNFFNSSSGTLVKFLNAKVADVNYQLPTLTLSHKEDVNHWYNNYKKNLLKGVTANRFVSIERSFALSLGKDLMSNEPFSESFISCLKTIYDLRYERSTFDVEKYPNGFYVNRNEVSYEDANGDFQTYLKLN